MQRRSVVPCVGAWMSGIVLVHAWIPACLHQQGCQQRRLDLLTITAPENLDPDENQRVVFVTARVHPGETPASFVCQGWIDFLVSQHPIARVLRQHLVFKIVPMLNPDGVYLGNYRCSLMGFDLNRHWQDPSPWAHPTLQATKQLLMDLNGDEKVDLDFYIDIHAHSTLMNGFMYGNVYDEEDRFEQQMVFPRLLGNNAEDFSLANTNFNRDAVKAGTGRSRSWLIPWCIPTPLQEQTSFNRDDEKAGTGRRFLGGALDDNCSCYTLEVSFFSYLTNSSSVPTSTDMKLGRNVARTFLDFYKLEHLINPKPTPGPQYPRGQRNSSGRGKDRDRERGRDSRGSRAASSQQEVGSYAGSASGSSLDAMPVHFKMHHRDGKKR
ncbi:Cytosolic carboxypeptidase 6 [Branchiostoma belcheri]|nr:Cytosolic carboxypeptidase 6 [Branchiostoma belcheri]